MDYFRSSCVAGLLPLCRSLGIAHAGGASEEHYRVEPGLFQSNRAARHCGPNCQSASVIIIDLGSGFNQHGLQCLFSIEQIL